MDAPPVGAKKPDGAGSIGENVYGSGLNRADRYALRGQVVPPSFLGWQVCAP